MSGPFCQKLKGIFCKNNEKVGNKQSDYVCLQKVWDAILIIHKVNGGAVYVYSLSDILYVLLLLYNKTSGFISVYLQWKILTIFIIFCMTGDNKKHTTNAIPF